VTRYRSGEPLVFGVATVLLTVHALDDAFVHRQAGVGLGQHALAALISVCACLAGVVAFPRLRPGLRAALSFGFGALALVNGMLHVRHITLDGPAASDLTGVLAAIAGAVMIGLAIAIPWRHRGEGTATSKRRWAHRAVAVAVGLVAVIVVLGPTTWSAGGSARWGSRPVRTS
jgi:cbb3-type cytochrome oxidase subunit 1